MASPSLNSVLIIGKVWPEHCNTAAGVRTAQLLSILKRHGSSVSFASPAKPNAFTTELNANGIPAVHLPLNNTQAMKQLLESSKPTACIFDRFTTEEAFSFHLHNLLPDCLRVLDTQDLHFLRAARQRLILEDHTSIETAMAYRPCAHDPMLLRELSSIYRSDLSLVCSGEELRILDSDYNVPSNLLSLGSFFYPPPVEPSSSHVPPVQQSSSHVPPVQQSSSHVPPVQQSSPHVPPLQQPSRDNPNIPSPNTHVKDPSSHTSLKDPPADTSLNGPYSDTSPKAPHSGTTLDGPFSDTSLPLPKDLKAPGERQHFVFIGTFKHAPNVDGAHWLASNIWPLIRKQLATAECHVYGSYATDAARSIHNPKMGLCFKGHAPSLDILANYKVGLAPLRFGAGIKGKILDCWRYGTPVVTTPVGAEGLCGEHLNYERGKGNSSFDMEGVKESNNLCIGFKGGLGTATSADSFAADAIRLYSDITLWEQCSQQGVSNLSNWFSETTNGQQLIDALVDASNQMEQRRRHNFVGGMLWSNSQRSTEYFSRWVELKESRAKRAVE